MTAAEIKKTLQREFVRTIRKPFVDAVKEYDMVRPGDSVAVCISGGKDSMLLALLLQDLQRTVDFELKFLAIWRKMRADWMFRLKFSKPMCCASRAAIRPSIRAFCARKCGAAICTPRRRSAAAIK